MSDDVAAAPVSPPPPLPVAAASPAKRRRRFGLGALLLLIVPLGLCAPLCVVAVSSGGSVADVVVLELDLQRPVVEGSAGAGLLAGQAAMSSRDIVFALEKAATDPRVKGLYARIGGDGHGLATAMDIRAAVLAFRKSGKPAVAFSESFGELSPGTGGWFVATAFDEIWLQPAGTVSLTPLSAETIFVRDGLAKLGVEPSFSARKEYKNAVNTFTEQGLTAPHNEAMSALLTSSQQALVAAVAKDRPAVGNDAAVAAALAGGPFTDEQALATHLVDHLGYRDEALAAVAARAGLVDTKLVPLLWTHLYLERAGSPYSDGKGTGVAVVAAVGQIHRGKSTSDPLTGSNTVGSDTVASALRDAVNDDDIKAIVLRIDSPGGSVVASETIAHEVQRARAAGKPVIASMANIAGSGGYYIAMDADAIVASPGTITGSIGVYAGKMVTTKLWEQLGVNYETIAVGDADTSFFSTDAPYSAAARARLDGLVDGIYTSFVSKVAAGRHKTFGEIEPVARGRIWSGTDAHARGLVDVLGGWPETLAAVRTALKLEATASLHLVDLPAKKPPLAMALALLKGGDDGDNSNASGTIGTAVQVNPASVQRLIAAQAADPVWLQMPVLSSSSSSWTVLP